jgi:hypothetical protein
MPEILIQCVIVLYQCPCADSKTLHSFARFCQQQPELAQRTALLVYDNSPCPQEVSVGRWSCALFEYRHDAKNSGLATAYNEALKLAQQRSTEWLLLLDQDTTLHD